MSRSDGTMTTALADAALVLLRKQYKAATGAHKAALKQIADNLKANCGHGDALWDADIASAAAAVESLPEPARTGAMDRINAAAKDAERRGWLTEGVKSERERMTCQIAHDICGWESPLDYAYTAIGYPLSNAIGSNDDGR